MKRNELLWGIRRALQEVQRGHNARSFGFLIVFSLVLAWFFYALEPLFDRVNGVLLRSIGFSVPEASLSWGASLLQLVVPIGLLLGLVWLVVRYGRKRTEVYFEGKTPAKHEGLIVLLSPYSSRGVEADALQTPSDDKALDAVLKDEHQDISELRRQVFASTWGPLWVAVEHHWPRLRYCWIVSSGGAHGTYTQCEVAERLIQKAVPGPQPITCFTDVVVPNGNDVEQVAEVINEIYTEKLGGLNLDEEDVIADFTGATKGMTAGMILATLDQRRKIQYLRQHPKLLIPVPDGFQARTNTEIEDEGLLLYVKTSRRSVPQRRDES